MELGLSLGNRAVEDGSNNSKGFCMGLGSKRSSNSSSSSSPPPPERREKVVASSISPPHPPPSPPRLQLDLLPFSPVPRPHQPSPPLRFPWLADNLSSEPGSSDGPGSRTMEVNRRAAVGEMEEQSSPNSGTSSFMEFSLYTSTNSGGGGRGNNNNDNNKRENGENGNLGNNYGQELIGVGGTTTSRGSDDEENGSSTRKKLRLSKEQSAFLEESFKEHHTLNPKQKLALAKQLNLRPRQVEVWFQNRRARTKLKQTEVDCEYLKRYCETLTEENRRLQKELQELRALKTSQPFFMQLPATTLTMCPSCERVAPNSTSVPPATAATTSVSTTASAAAVTIAAKPDIGPGSITLSLGKPKPMLPFSQSQGQAHQAAS